MSDSHERPDYSSFDAPTRDKTHASLYETIARAEDPDYSPFDAPTRDKRATPDAPTLGKHARQAREQAAQADEKERTSQQSQRGKHARPAQHAAAQPQPSPTMRKAEPAPRTPLSRRAKRLIAVVCAVAAATVIAVAAFTVYAAQPITVTVNGKAVQLTDARSVQDAFEAAGSPAQAGDMYDVEGELYEIGGGDAYEATVNGEETDAEDTLHAGDVVVFEDGEDTEEPSVTSELQAIDPEVIVQGNGAIYTVVQEGTAGLGTVKDGMLSGKSVVLEVIEPATDAIYLRWSPNVGDDKVIALTFDDGPSSTYTSEILDILAEYDVKATFFTVGNLIESNADLVVRELEEGHQVCTHTWDHAAGDGGGVSLAYMTAEDQREEIEKGLAAIAEATGEEASTVIRAPGGNFPIEVWENVADLISAQVTWTVDTEDWTLPGADEIAESIMSAEAGDIVLMHDGGGDRSETVEALEVAIPYLLEQGYTFVTIDELMAYGYE